MPSYLFPFEIHCKITIFFEQRVACPNFLGIDCQFLYFCNLQSGILLEYYLHVWLSILQKTNKTNKLYMDNTVKYSEEDYKNIILPVEQEVWHPENIPYRYDLWNIHYSYFAVKDFWELTLELARENTDIVDIFSFQDCRCFRFFDESLRFNDLMSQYAKIEGRNPTLVKVENSAYLNLIAKLNVTLDIPNGLSHYLLLLN